LNLRANGIGIAVVESMHPPHVFAKFDNRPVLLSSASLLHAKTTDRDAVSADHAPVIISADRALHALPLF
jgi:hypothetical protein